MEPLKCPMSHPQPHPLKRVPAPAAVGRLPVDETRGYPVPWFVAWIAGRPEFRVADGDKLNRAILERRCWVCGEKLNNRVAFTVGPMCTISRISAAPPAHIECAEYSVKVCPFLSRPAMVRREGGLPEEATVAGTMIVRNPGVVAIWTTKSPGFHLLVTPTGILFQIQDPVAVSWWREGRAATRAEVQESIESGLPALRDIAARQGPLAVDELLEATLAADKFFPAA